MPYCASISRLTPKFVHAEGEKELTSLEDSVDQFVSPLEKLHELDQVSDIRSAASSSSSRVASRSGHASGKSPSVSPLTKLHELDDASESSVKSPDSWVAPSGDAHHNGARNAIASEDGYPRAARTAWDDSAFNTILPPPNDPYSQAGSPKLFEISCIGRKWSANDADDGSTDALADAVAMFERRELQSALEETLPESPAAARMRAPLSPQVPIPFVSSS
eukprot:gnl/TRDRNA2_/TRDRNA2_142934_c2_seq1.p1 gnl/TRDRNA2_/TRDRNA2_142934_c2~~gnl/TRDRNA2_/TRDRNA2_142934_c2_seq1.p1  ORF type:complete len:220 (-),score=30.58 gnl/TRDRNA2_/TRDRNA2_142934_c2_seq1:132-791(-)